MVYLKYYEKEKQELANIGFNLDGVLDEKTALKLIKKLSRHFKIIEPEIYFYGKIDYGFAYRNKNMIKLAHNPTIGTLIHELGHIYMNQNNLVKEKAHTKKLLRIVKRFANYVMKKDYWFKEIDK